MDKTFILPLFGGGGSTKDATVTPNDLLEGVTAYGKDGKIEGTIPVKSEDDIIVEERTTTIPAGYYSTEIETSVSEEYIIPEGTLTVTKSGETDVREYEKVDVPVAVAEFLHNGTYRAEDMGVLGYEQVDVNVTPNLQDKLITENGTYTAGIGYDGLGTVLVNVDAEPNLQDKLITTNGVYHADVGYDGLGTVTVEAVHGDFDYLCFTAVDAGSTVGMKHYGANLTATKPLIFISTDHKETWRVWDYETITLAGVGDKVYMYGTNESIGVSENNYSQFKMTGKISATGNIQTLLAQDGSRPGVSAYCYESIFYDCTSLVTAPKLPATKLAGYCYNNMFYGCTSLTAAPELPATELAAYCYQDMFRNCTNLRIAPELPATELATNCYERMFDGCTSLTVAPELPATTLASSCYRSMFYGCTSLTVAPKLPATKLVSYCYQSMLSSCSNLNSIITYASPWDTSSTSYWVSGVSPTGTFFKDPNATIPTGTNGIPSGWVVYDLVAGTVDRENKTITLTTNLSNATIYYTTDGSEPTTSSEVYTGPISIPEGSKYYVVKAIAANDDITLPSNTISYSDYFYFEAIEAGSTFKISSLYSGCTYEYSRDGITWTNLGTTTITLANVGDRAYIRQSSDKGYWQNSNSSSYSFKATGNLKVGGCISTLAYKDASHDRPNMSSAYSMSHIFDGCKAITDASDLKLDFVELTEGCYMCMFQSCTSLTAAPELPVTKLAYQCYRYMFSGCTSLTAAPELPATKLTDYCYDSMFRNCTSLTTVPELPATELAEQCYTSMFEDCTSLTTAPKLSATKLYNSCYYRMFYGCRSLNSIIVHATSWNTSNTSYWVYGVSPTGTFTCPSSLSIPTSTNGIPSGWIRVDL